MEATLSPKVQILSDSKARARSTFLSATDWITCLAFLGDFISIMIATTLALVTRHYCDFGFRTKAFYPADYLNVILLGTLTYQFILHMNGAYRKHRFVHRFHILNVALKTSAIWLVAFVTITFVFQLQSTISRLFVVWSLMNTVLLLFAWRMAFRRVLF